MYQKQKEIIKFSIRISNYLYLLTKTVLVLYISESR